MNPLRRQVTDDRAVRLQKVMRRLRGLDREVPAQVLHCLFYIAARENCHKQALEEDLKMTTASASRNTDWLSQSHRIKGADGLGLITKEQDPDNRRRIQLRLTPAGQDLMDELYDLLYVQTTQNLQNSSASD